MCDKAIKKWRDAGPKLLNEGPWEPDGTKKENPDKYNSGVWLFTDRNNITDYIAPNFFPPYDTPNKKQMILAFLNETWDEHSLSWKKCKATKKEPDFTLSDFIFSRSPSNQPPKR